MRILYFQRLEVLLMWVLQIDLLDIMESDRKDVIDSNLIFTPIEIIYTIIAWILTLLNELNFLLRHSAIYIYIYIIPNVMWEHEFEGLCDLKESDHAEMNPHPGLWKSIYNVDIRIRSFQTSIRVSQKSLEAFHVATFFSILYNEKWIYG